MKRRHLVVLVSAITLITIVFVVAVTIGVGVGTNPGRQQIRNLIQQQLGNRIHGKIYIGRIGGGLLTGFTLDTFAIRDKEDSLLVSTGRISLDYDPRDLLDRRLLLRNVTVEHPVVRIHQHQKGDWNFQRIFRKTGPSTPSVPGRSFGDYVVLDSVRVHDAQVILTRPWQPDDSLKGAKRDSAIRVNMASTHREIRRSNEGYTHTYRWIGATAFLPHIRLFDPDSNKFGQRFVIESMRVEEQEPPFSFRGLHGVVRKLGDSVFVDAPRFALPASYGSASAKIWWGSDLPVRLDIRIRGDSVAMKDVAWIYPTLPTTGGGRTLLHITNNKENLHVFEYALTEMDVRSTKSRLTGAMTFVVGGPVLAVRDVDLRASPVNFDLLRTLAGAPFPVDWQGDLYGFARGPGGPLTHFVVDTSEITWRDTHVAGAVTKGSGQGELDILYPALTAFHGFNVSLETLDTRSIEYLFPSFPRVHGTISGTATLDSSWLDVRFSNADIIHRLGDGEPNHVTGAGRLTWQPDFMKFDVDVKAQPVSLTMLSRAYPLGLQGLMQGPIQAKGTAEDMQLTMDLTGAAGRITYSGKVDAYPLSVAANGNGRVEGLDPSQLVAQHKPPRASLTGTYQLNVRGDTNDLATLRGDASLLLERSLVDGIRVFPSQMRARFASGRMYLDTLRVESVAASISAGGALGLSSRTPDSLAYSVVVDSLGGLRQYVSRFTSAWAQPVGDAGPPQDSLAGSVKLTGYVRGSVQAVDIAGTLIGSKIYVRREAGREVTGTFAITNALTAPAGNFAIRLNGFTVGPMALDTLGATIRVEPDRSGTFSLGALAKNGVTLDATGNLSLADSARTDVVVRAVALTTDSSRWMLRGTSGIHLAGRGIAIDSLILANGLGGRISLEGYVPDSGSAKVIFRADSVSLHDVSRVAQLKPLSGWAQITAQGAGTNSAPVVNLQANLHDVRYGGIRAERVEATAAYVNKRAQVALDLTGGGRTALRARGSLPLELKYFGARLLEDSLRGTVRTDNASFGILEAVVPGLDSATGQLVANLDIGGTWKHPDVAGALRVDDGEVTVNALGVRMKGVNVDLALFGHSDSLAVRRVSAWSGTSPADSLSLSGYIAYRDMENPYLSLLMNARTVHILDKRSLARLDVSTDRNGIRLRGRLQGATLTGNLVVDRGTIFLPDPALARKQAVDISSALNDTSSTVRRLLPAAPSKLLENIILDNVRIALGDEVWLRSREANIKLGGSLNVQSSVRKRRGTILGVGTLTGTDSLALALEGQLRAERGTYTLVLAGLVQREFQVEGGTITFFPTPELAPELNISALHTVRTETGSDLRIRVRITGALYPNPIVSLESAESFEVSQSDLLSYLMFGQQNFELGNENQSYVKLAAQTLFPSAQSFVTSQMRGLLGSWADVIQVRPGLPTTLDQKTVGQGKSYTEIFWTSRLGAEKQLTENLFVSVSTPLCQLGGASAQANNSTQPLDFYSGLSGKVELRLSRDASIKAGKEPNQMVCNPRANQGRLVPAPSQWGFSLFKSWRF